MQHYVMDQVPRRIPGIGIGIGNSQPVHLKSGKTAEAASIHRRPRLTRQYHPHFDHQRQGNSIIWLALDPQGISSRRLCARKAAESAILWLPQTPNTPSPSREQSDRHPARHSDWASHPRALASASRGATPATTSLRSRVALPRFSLRSTRPSTCSRKLYSKKTYPKVPDPHGCNLNPKSNLDLSLGAADALERQNQMLGSFDVCLCSHANAAPNRHLRTGQDGYL